MPRLERIAAVTVALFAAATATHSAANPRCDSWSARLVSAQGVVQVQYSDTADWRPTELDQTFCLGDRVRTRDSSRAALELRNDTLLRLDQNTTLLLPEAATEDDFWVDLLDGALHLLSRVKRSLEIRTPFVNAGLEGTEFVVRVLEAQTIVSVLEGRVAVSNALGRLSLTPGQTASASRGTPPVLRLEIRPEDTVHWALYYPLVVDPDQPGADRNVLAAQRELGVGRADRARAQLDALLARDPKNARALALAAIAALVQNATDQAAELAERAVASAPVDSSAQLALSYVRQARFDLPGARAAIDAALAGDPNDALAWARLAELQAAFGETNEAIRTAERAVELKPGLSRTHSVLGFAALSRLDLAQAVDAFDNAITLDPADPLPRVGQALVKIRRGELVEGRRDLEIAVSLDPGNALIRSYLGKAYFQEDRDIVAGVELANAKGLDPHDPTPWLFDGLLKQSENRPGEALKDIQTSIRLNNNRAVYRSRLLLDQDVAARRTSLGAIYRDLDFTRLGAFEGHRSLATDPANFAAHNLLADSYAALPRHDVARVSEQHQALRLSPPGASPPPPQYGFAGLALPENAAMRSVTANEFGPLFNLEGPSFRVNGLAGSNGTWGDELVLSGLQQNLGYSLGQFHYETDGYRENNDLRHDIFSVFANLGIASGSHVQFEFLDRDTEFGDLRLQFDPQAFDRNDRRKIDEHVVSVSGYHQLSPETSLVGSLSYINRTADSQIDDRGTVPGFGQIGLLVDRTSKTKGLDGELQFIVQQPAFNAVAGLRHLDLERTDTGTQEIYGVTLAPPFFMPVQTVTTTLIRDSDAIRDTRGYLYTTTSVNDASQLVLGLAVDKLDNPRRNGTEFNPKVGLSWQAGPQTRIRAAALRTVALPVAAKRTLEPSQVAGFNQFFDDPDGSISDRYGLGLDHRFTDALYAGAEITRRDLDIPLSAGAETRERDEQFHTAHLYWLPDDQLAVSLEYTYESVENDRRSTDRPTEVTTQTLRGGLKVTAPNGLIGSVAARYVDHEAEFPAVSTTDSGKDHFMIVDASLGWRLPGRRGLLEVGVNNLFDQDFRYEDPYFGDPSEPALQPFQPERFVYGRLTLSF